MLFKYAGHRLIIRQKTLSDLNLDLENIPEYVPKTGTSLPKSPVSENLDIKTQEMSAKTELSFSEPGSLTDINVAEVQEFFPSTKVPVEFPVGQNPTPNDPRTGTSLFPEQEIPFALDQLADLQEIGTGCECTTAIVSKLNPNPRVNKSYSHGPSYFLPLRLSASPNYALTESNQSQS